MAFVGWLSWLSFRLGNRARSNGSDPADHGTAWGLDMSIPPQDDDDAPWRKAESRRSTGPAPLDLLPGP